MYTKTKTQPTHTEMIWNARYDGNPWNRSYGTVYGGSQTISYQKGMPQFSGHRLNWKECEHTATNVQTGTIGTATTRYGKFDYEYYGVAPLVFSSNVGPAPEGEFDRGVIYDILNQVDLNCKDSVLIYSGVLQAIPLLGGCLKLNKILNDVGSHISKGLRRQPFTTVIKSLISADFIDRFVIKPTLDDARKFADATDYVLRVMQTAYERSAMPVGLRAKRIYTPSMSTSSFTNYIIGRKGFRGSLTKVKAVTSEAFMLLQMHYDTHAIDPIKLWASRVGLTKPLESAWDLVPFSFVVDYFTRAGDLISRLSESVDAQHALVGKITNIYSLWGSLKRETAQIASATAFLPDDETIKTFVPSTARRSTYSYSRFPIPRPWTELSSFKGADGFFDVRLSNTRIRTLAQLFIQAKL